jgi:hypothetical protein
MELNSQLYVSATFYSQKELTLYPLNMSVVESQTQFGCFWLGDRSFVSGGFDPRFVGRLDRSIVTLSTTLLLLMRGNYCYILLVDAIRGDLLRRLVPVKYMLNILLSVNGNSFCVTFITR